MALCAANKVVTLYHTLSVKMVEMNQDIVINHSVLAGADKFPDARRQGMLIR